MATNLVILNFDLTTSERQPHIHLQTSPRQREGAETRSISSSTRWVFAASKLELLLPQKQRCPFGYHGFKSVVKYSGCMQRKASRSSCLRSGAKLMRVT
ncbi:hypothetical protein TNCV_3158981 [Trichonephila clavipes]|nr:hypothetical protein TNCV_3158981 [Trichonephila clavipes]